RSPVKVCFDPRARTVAPPRADRHRLDSQYSWILPTGQKEKDRGEPRCETDARKDQGRLVGRGHTVQLDNEDEDESRTRDGEEHIHGDQQWRAELKRQEGNVLLLECGV